MKWTLVGKPTCCNGIRSRIRPLGRLGVVAVVVARTARTGPASGDGKDACIYGCLQAATEAFHVYDRLDILHRQRKGDFRMLACKNLAAHLQGCMYLLTVPRRQK